MTTEAQSEIKKRVRAPRHGAPAADMSALLDAIRAQGEELRALRAKVETVSAGAPQFIPMRREETVADRLAGTYQTPEDRLVAAKRSLTAPEQSTSGNTGPLENPAYLSRLPPNQRPKYRSGDLVRINPETHPHGDAIHTWGDILARTASQGLGEVLSVQYLTKTWEPKYTVFVKGLTGRNGDGFRESELLRA